MSSSSSSSSSLLEKNVHIKLKTFSFSDAYQIVHLQLANIHRHSRMEKSSCKRTTDTHSKTKELFTLFSRLFFARSVPELSHPAQHRSYASFTTAQLSFSAIVVVGVLCVRVARKTHEKVAKLHRARREKIETSQFSMDFFCRSRRAVSSYFVFHPALRLKVSTWEYVHRHTVQFLFQLRKTIRKRHRVVCALWRRS